MSVLAVGLIVLGAEFSSMRFACWSLFVTLLACACTPVQAPQEVSHQSPTPQTRLVDKGETPVSAPRLSDEPLVLKAEWEPFKGQDWERLQYVPRAAEYLKSLSQDLVATRSHPGTDFSIFLPTGEARVGDIWAVDAAAVAEFATQLHPGATHEMRRDGVGCYAILRAQSEERLEIAFRAHVQFRLVENSSLTPGQFAGRLIVDRSSGRVAYFEMRVPTENVRNVNFEFNHLPRSTVGSVFTPRMELVGGDHAALASSSWREAKELDSARELLTERFYAFKAIDWVPLEQVLTRAREVDKPILVFVIEGVLDDQSC